MADDESTASEPDATAPELDITSPDDVNISASPAAVTWDGCALPLCDVTCDIRRYASNSTAFIKLRATAALKVPGPAKTSIFLFVHPERIRTVVLDESPGSASQETVKQKLGRNTYCLRFTLDTPAALVGPASPENITPKNKSSGEVLHHLRLLSRETQFAVYLPAKVVTKARLLSLCEAASDCGLRSISWQADMTCLYGGKGGRIIEDGPRASSANPPSYDELEPGPPMPPTSHGSSSQGPSKKRRRDSGGPGASSADLSAMETMCRKIMGEMKVELKKDMSNRLQQLETTIMERIEQRLAEESARIEEHVDQQLLEVREETTDEIGTRIEDEYYGVRLRLEEFVKDEVQDAEERIVHHIESSATVSLQFNT
ncbi:hypothetical protein UCDDA912_g03330 [Diaporthe ampelina]|uniref:Uncharacterized protein n=1 Tax=Diaporthe ampelina TaxID=1214573 RepID=A0A0G2HP03_9PEZI|nr:hypothetical protein UCDDA912_g03330 [Diaporthe ampelina]